MVRIKTVALVTVKKGHVKKTRPKKISFSTLSGDKKKGNPGTIPTEGY